MSRFDQTAKPSAPVLPTIETQYLRQLKLSHRARARAAIRWRPRLLKALADSCSFTLAVKAAGISYNTFLHHQRQDPEFASQVTQAEEAAVDLLHAKCFQAALEGQLEPVYFQGKVIGHTRKFDSRLAIELLRAHMPDKFRTPGIRTDSTPQNAHACDNGLIATKEVLAMIQAARRANLAALARELGLDSKTPPAISTEDKARITRLGMDCHLATRDDSIQK